MMEHMEQKAGQPGQSSQRQAIIQTPSQQPPPPPIYDTRNGGHYGASASLAGLGYTPSPDLHSSSTWANINQGLEKNARDILTTYWQHIVSHLETDNHDYKIHQLPLARIKKVMKADPEVKMISAEAPILFAKGCDIFITELTMRAWIHAEDNKRRTLQRSDIAAALAKSDMFDFLIDIVPREEAAAHTKRSSGAATGVPQAGQIPPQQGIPHGMAAPDYGALTGHMPQDADYRQQAMYGGAVQGDGGYGQQPQIFDGMYGYPHIPPQQVHISLLQRLPPYPSISRIILTRSPFLD
ncbi:hypothetical protein FQN57_001888 [Myotisia sp. PD_48]|nr:hypothetical protein FQN57_001888 [Myotisia sp. PD_48]